MTALSFATLAGGGPLVQQPVPVPKAMSSTEAFQDALSRQTAAADLAAQTQPVVPPVPDPSSVTAPGAIKADNGLDAGTVERERVRKSLGLEGAKSSTVTTGDTILGGLQNLRHVFDTRTHHISDIMKSNVATTQALMGMQMEVAQYTVMVDVSSKLMGKASSSLDTLMKGQ